MTRVFISHATPDRPFIERELLPLLISNGLEPWYARDDIQAADEWERTILQGLQSYDYFLLVMSPRSAQSPWVKREVDWAFNKGKKPIVPVLIQDCDSDSFHFGMASIQFVDFRHDPATAGQRLLAAFRAKMQQPAWMRLANPFTNSLGMKFVLVPPGSFGMGRIENRHETVGQRVELPSAYYFGAYPVTQGQWQAVMGSNPSYFAPFGPYMTSTGKKLPVPDLPQFPVENVDWNDAQEFIKKLNATETNAEWVYRLPRETEWEYACRGRASSSEHLALTQEECSFDYYFEQPTNDLSSQQANVLGDHPVGWAERGPTLGRTSKVGSFKPNRLGIHDLHGNVREWCDDLSSEGQYRGLRGGSWYDRGEECSAGFRLEHVPNSKNSFIGFRLVRVPASLGS